MGTELVLTGSLGVMLSYRESLGGLMSIDNLPLIPVSSSSPFLRRLYFAFYFNHLKGTFHIVLLIRSTALGCGNLPCIRHAVTDAIQHCHKKYPAIRSFGEGGKFLGFLLFHNYVKVIELALYRSTQTCRF